MGLKFTGSYDDLKLKLSSLSKDWDESHPNKKVLRLNNGLMNWFETTGSINFQGKDPWKTELEIKVPNALYPQETVIAESVQITQSAPGVSSSKEQPMSCPP